MARSGDALGYYYEEGYIDEDYIRYEPYIEEGYITDDYFLGEGAVLEANANLSSAVTISVDATRIQEGAADLDVVAAQTSTIGKLQSGEAHFTGAFVPVISAVVKINSTAILNTFTSISATVSPIRDNDAALNNIVNLSLQGAKFAGFESTQAAAFTQTSAPSRTRDYGADLVSSASISVNPTTSTDVTASLDSAFQQTADAQVVRFIEAEASLASEFAQTASAIEYQAKTLPFGRPNPFVGYMYNGLTNTWTQDNNVYNYQTSQKTNGSYGIEFDESQSSSVYEYPALASQSSTINIGANEDFLLHTYVAKNDTSTDTQNRCLISFGNGFNTISEISDRPNHADLDGIVNIGLERISSSVSYLYGRVRKNDGSYIELTTTNQFTSGRIGIRRSGNTIQLISGATVLDSATYSGALYSGGNQITLYPGEKASSVVDPAFDLTVMKVGDAGPTNLFYVDDEGSDEYTVVYADFEQTLDDDTALTLDGAATLNAEFTQTALIGAKFDSQALVASLGTMTVDANVVADADANITAQASISTQGGFLKDFSTDFDSIATQISVVNKIGNTLVALDNNFTFSADVNEIVQLASNLNSAFTASADVNATFVDSADFAVSSEVTVDASGGFIGLPAQTLAFTSTLASTGERIRFIELDAQAGEFAQTTTANVTRDGVLDAHTAFTQADTDYIRYRDSSADFGALFTPSIEAVAKINSTAILDTRATMTVDAVVIASGGILLSSAATQTAVAVKTTDSTATFASEFAQATQGTSNITGESSVNISFTISVDAVKITELDTEFTSIASVQTATLSAIRGVSSALNTNFAQTATVERFRQGASALNSTFAKTANAGILTDITLDLGALFTPSIDYRIIHVDQYVYTIPSEIRLHTIERESRSFTITEETRTYSIPGD